MMLSLLCVANDQLFLDPLPPQDSGRPATPKTILPSPAPSSPQANWIPVKQVLGQADHYTASLPGVLVKNRQIVRLPSALVKSARQSIATEWNGAHATCSAFRLARAGSPCCPSECGPSFLRGLNSPAGRAEIDGCVDEGSPASEVCHGVRDRHHRCWEDAVRFGD